MSEKLAIGDTAPNFDLASTEDAVLMLCDEVPRMAVLLYFFADPEEERVREDLQGLAAAQHDLATNRAVILGISGTKLPGLKKAQSELGLRFPLLYDDRDFSTRYGIEAPEEGSAAPGLFLVDRDQRIIWCEQQLRDLTEALSGVLSVLKNQPAQTYHYPARVVNRVVNWWVNKVRPRPAA